MRRAHPLPTLRRRFSRTAALLGLVLTGWGCQQPPVYIYYGPGAPACVPVVPAPASPVYGNAGEPATEVIEGGTTYVETPERTMSVTGSSTPRRVVVSEPEQRSRVAWRRKSEPDPVVATSVEGGTRMSDDSTVR